MTHGTDAEIEMNLSESETYEQTSGQQASESL